MLSLSSSVTANSFFRSTSSSDTLSLSQAAAVSSRRLLLARVTTSELNLSLTTSMVALLDLTR
jgi:hypothetical protein